MIGAAKNTEIFDRFLPQFNSWYWTGTRGPPAELRLRSVDVHTHTPLLFLCVICVRLQTVRSKWCSTVGRLAHLLFSFWVSILPLHFFSHLTCCAKLMVVYQLSVSALQYASYRQMQTVRREVFFPLLYIFHLWPVVRASLYRLPSLKKGVVLVLTCPWPLSPSCLTPSLTVTGLPISLGVPLSVDTPDSYNHSVHQRLKTQLDLSRLVSFVTTWPVDRS